MCPLLHLHYKVKIHEALANNATFVATSLTQWDIHDSAQGMYCTSWLQQCSNTTQMQLTCIDIDAKVHAIPSFGCMLLPELVQYISSIKSGIVT